jgi:hypothetical protein
MYPDDFNKYGYEQLLDWRTRILEELQQVEEQALDAGIDPKKLNVILEIGKALGKVESEIRRFLE